ncbi:MAG: DNA polymerase III subunit delta [Gemmatimonadaceae bacterium]
MAPSPHRALKRAIEDRSFDPVYYFHGENDFSKEEAGRQLIDAVVDPSTRDFNLEVRRGGDLDASTIASLLSTPPMMAERRMVVVRDVASLKKDARAVVEKYVAKPSRDTVLLLLAAADSAKVDKVFQQSATVVAFSALNENQLHQWIIRQASNGGATITERASQLLHAAVGNDLPQLATEIDKLISYSSDQPIDADAVTSVVGVREGETLPDFLDCIARRDSLGASALLPQILAQPKINPVYLVMIMTIHILAIAWGRAKSDEGMSASILEREYFGLLKETGSGLTGRPWGDAIRAWVAAVPKWSTESLDHAIEALLVTDNALKDTRVSSEEQVMSSLVLALCTPHERLAA